MLTVSPPEQRLMAAEAAGSRPAPLRKPRYVFRYDAPSARLSIEF